MDVLAGTASREQATTAVVLSWRRLAIVAGLVALAGHLVVGAALRDLDAVFIAIGFGLALAMVSVRRGTVGEILLVLSFANVAFWTTTAMIANLGDGGTFLAVALPSSMAILAGVGGVAATSALVRRSEPHPYARGPRRTAVVGTVLLAAVLVGAAFVGGSPSVPQDAVRITTDRTAFSAEEFALTSGATTIAVENRDYFWHTFTVRELDIDLRVPVGATRAVTVDLPEGRFDFVCAIPGHDTAGMEGVLIVEAAP